MSVDDVLQSAIEIMTDLAIMVEDHNLAILGGIGVLGGQRGDIRIAIVGKLHPDATHQVGQFQVVGWQALTSVVHTFSTQEFCSDISSS